MERIWELDIPLQTISDKTGISRSTIYALAVLYIQRSHGEKVEVNRYFKEGEKSFIEISPEEYEERKKMHEKRQEQEAKAQDEN